MKNKYEKQYITFYENLIYSTYQFLQYKKITKLFTRNNLLVRNLKYFKMSKNPDINNSDYNKLSKTAKFYFKHCNKFYMNNKSTIKNVEEKMNLTRKVNLLETELLDLKKKYDKLKRSKRTSLKK